VWLHHPLRNHKSNITNPISHPLSEIPHPNSSLPRDCISCPTLPDNIYQSLPQLLQSCCTLFPSSKEKDVFLLGALAVLSGCLPNIQGTYFNEPVSPHLYVFITAPAGSGKGKLKWAKHLGMVIHKEIVQEANLEKEKYNHEIDNYNNLSRQQRQGRERPKEPKRKMFFIPANISTSAFIQALSDNNFKGILFETEADTLSNTLKQEWGNFSDVLRKAFHHEGTNMFRRKDNEYIEVEDPHLAIALSGTPKQVHTMMPDGENGLFSRFLYYAFEDYSDFKNPFQTNTNTNYSEFFNQKGQEIYELYHILKKFQNPIQFTFSEEQAQEFTQGLNQIYHNSREQVGNEFNANSRRLGIITFRIAMILSALRILEHGDTSLHMPCSNTDFQTAITITTTLVQHAMAVFTNLPDNKLQSIKDTFLQELPQQFTRKQYLAVAKQLAIKPKTAEKYITQWKEKGLLRHEYNNYSKQ
jgi:hypothetical protein